VTSLKDLWQEGRAQYDGPSRYIWAFSLFPAIAEKWDIMKAQWAAPGRYIWAFSIFPAVERWLRGTRETR